MVVFDRLWSVSLFCGSGLADEALRVNMLGVAFLSTVGALEFIGVTTFRDFETCSLFMFSFGTIL